MSDINMCPRDFPASFELKHKNAGRANVAQLILSLLSVDPANRPTALQV